MIVRYACVLIFILLLARVFLLEGQETPTPDTAALDAARLAYAYFSANVRETVLGIRLELKLTFETQSPDVQIITWPEFPKAWGAFEVVETVPLSESRDGLTRRFEQELSVILWMPGIYKVPDTFIAYQIGEQEVYNLPVEPVTFTVLSVLDGSDFALRPLKPPIGLPYVSPLWAAAGIGAGVFGVRRWLLWRSRKRQLVPEIKTPAQIALDTLRHLTRGELSPQEIYPQTADCLRGYVQGRLGLPAQDMTTTELNKVLETQMADRLRRELNYILEHADLVKFARFVPSATSAGRLVAAARAWIERAEVVTTSPVEGRFDV